MHSFAGMADSYEVDLLKTGFGFTGKCTTHSSVGFSGTPEGWMGVDKCSGFAASESAPCGGGSAVSCETSTVPYLLAAAAANVTAAVDFYTQLRRRVSELLQQRSRADAVVVLEAGIYCMSSFLQRNECG